MLVSFFGTLRGGEYIWKIAGCLMILSVYKSFQDKLKSVHIFINRQNKSSTFYNLTPNVLESIGFHLEEYPIPNPLLVLASTD